ncbi:MAG: glycosyltransferase family 4 protein [Myxococcota bacterium]
MSNRAKAKASPRTRVLMASPLPPPLGGISAWTQRILASPLAERCEIEVFDTAPPEKTDVSGASRFRFDRAWTSLAMLARFRRALRRFKPDVVHVNTSYHWAMLRDGLFVRLAERRGIPAALHFRGGDFPESVAAAPAPVRRWIRGTLRRASALIALTDHTRKFLGTCTDTERVHVLPNFVDVERFRAPDRSARSNEKVEVLYVGWILPAKGVRELLEATLAIPPLRLTLIGHVEVEFRRELEATIGQLGDRVTFLDPRPPDELIPLYEKADIFALPSWREGFPSVIVEAMAAGLPIVSTPVGAIAYIVRDGTDGLLVAARDGAALQRALASLVCDPARRRALGAAGRERVEALYAREQVLAQLEAFWRRLAESA